MANCVSSIAGNIGLDCEHPIEGGYTGRGVLIPMESNPVLTRDAQNPRIIKSITIAESAKVCVVDNAGAAPFDGSSTTGNNDSGFTKFTKAMALRILARGAKASKDVIEPLVKSGRGFIGIFEKVDQVGDGSFEVIGAQSPLKCADPATFTRSETANGGAWSGTLQCSEHWAELVLFDTDYETSLAAFEALLAKGF